MKSLTERVDRATEYDSGVSSVADAYRHVLTILEREKKDYEAEIWDRRLSPDSYREKRAEYNRLCDDIKLVEAVFNIRRGIKAVEGPTYSGPRPEKGYGER